MKNIRQTKYEPTELHQQENTSVRACRHEDAHTDIFPK